MKITKRQLERIIREEARKLTETRYASGGSYRERPETKQQPTSDRNFRGARAAQVPPVDTRTVGELQSDITRLEAELDNLPVLSVAKDGLEATIRADAKRTHIKDQITYASRLLKQKGSVAESRLRRAVRQEIAKLSNS